MRPFWHDFTCAIIGMLIGMLIGQFLIAFWYAAIRSNIGYPTWLDKWF